MAASAEIMGGPKGFENGREPRVGVGDEREIAADGMKIAASALRDGILSVEEVGDGLFGVEGVRMGMKSVA